MVVVSTFGIIIALCTSFIVKLTSGTVKMFQGALTSRKEDPSSADSLNNQKKYQAETNETNEMDN